MRTSVCPNDDTLRGYALGDVDHTVASHTESHLSDCESCQNKVETLLSDGDVMILQLRSMNRNSASSATDTFSFAANQSMTDTSASISLNPKLPEQSRSDDFLRHLFSSRSEYDLLTRIGAGGMGEVWKARHRKLAKLVAIKLIRSGRANDGDYAQRFLREMRAIGQLDHSNVVRATDAGELDGILYLVMEYIDGADAGQIAKAHGGLPVQEAAEILRQAAMGLQHIHDQGIIHRDLKPNNLMVSKEGVVKILDAGLARWQESDEQSLTGTGHLVGTPDYMSPEQWLEPDRLTPSSDIYSLGCTFYCLLCGHAPFGTDDCSSFGKKMEAHRHAKVPELKKVVNAKTIGPLLGSMLEKHADHRPQSAETVAKACRDFAQKSDLKSLLSPRGIQERAEVVRPEVRLDKQHAPGDALAPTLASEEVDRRYPPRVPKVAFAFFSFAFLAAAIVVIIIIREKSDPRKTEEATTVIAQTLVVPDPDQLTTSKDDGYGLIKKLVGHDDTISCVAFTASGNLVSSSADGTVRYWEGDTWEQRQLEDCGGVGALVVSHSDRSVYGIGGDGNIYGWDLESGKLIMKLEAHQGRGAFLDIAPNDSMLLSSAKDGTVRLWDPASKKEIWSLPAHTKRVGEVRFNPGMINGEYVLTADIDGLHYWNTVTKTKVQSYPGRRRAIFTPNGKRILAGSTAPGVAYLRQLELDDPIHQFSNFEHVVRSLSMSPSGDFACVGLHDGTLRIWDLVSGQETLQIQSPSFCTNEVSISRDGTRIAFGGGYDPMARHNPASEDQGDKGDYAIRVWRLPSAQPSTKTSDPTPVIEVDADLPVTKTPNQGYGLVQKLEGHRSRIDSFVFLPDGDLISTSSKDRTIRHWDVRAGNEIGRFESPHGALKELVVSHSGKEVYGIDSGGMILGWNVKSRERIMEVKGHDGIGLFIDISPDDSTLVSSAKDGSVKLWDTVTKQEVGTLPGHSTRIRQVRFNHGFASGEYLMTADDGKLRYWNAKTKEVLKTFAGRRTFVFTPDGRSFLAGSSVPGVAYLQRLDAGEPDFQFRNFTNVVRRLAMAPSGHSAYVGLQDKSLRVWDMKSGRETMKINNPTNGSIEVAVSHDGRLLAFGSGYDELAKFVPGADDDAEDTGDYSIRIWRVPID